MFVTAISFVSLTVPK